MAVALATRAKCVIQPPPWMEPPALEEVLRKERESEAEFQARTLARRRRGRLARLQAAARRCACLLRRGCSAAARALFAAPRRAARPPGPTRPNRTRGALHPVRHSRCRFTTSRSPWRYLNTRGTLSASAGSACTTWLKISAGAWHAALRLRLRRFGRLADRRAAVQLQCESSALTPGLLLCACSVRFSKIERGLRRLDGASAAYIRLNNVSAMEVRL